MNFKKCVWPFSVIFFLLSLGSGCANRQEKISAEIEWIKKKYAEINNNLGKFKIVKDCDLPGISPEREPYEYKEMGGPYMPFIKVERWYQEGQLVKTGVQFEGGRRTYHSEYYYHNKQPFFVFKQRTEFDNPPGSIYFDSKNKKIFEDRFYFHEKKLIQWIDQNKQSKASTDADFKKKENQILSDAGYYQDAFIVEKKEDCAGEEEPSIKSMPPSGEVKNPENDPAIVKIRTMVQEIEKEIDSKKITMTQRSFPYCIPYQDTNRRLYQNEKKLVVKYIKEGGSDDSARTVNCYYDNKERIRFVFITAGAVNGSQLEHRIYFDETGQRLWETQKYTDGPGYTFPDIWEDEDLVFDPRKEFDSEVKCDMEE
jgi:hypothetical protein